MRDRPPGDLKARLARAEAALARTRADLDEVQALAQVGGWEWDVGADVVRWTDELHRIFGVPRDLELSYAGFLALVHPEDQARAREVVGQALADCSPFEFDHRVVRPDGAVRIVHGRGRVVVDESGKPQRMLGTAQDVTERREAEARERTLLVEQGERAAAELAAARFHFLAEASARLGSSLDVEVTLRSVTRLAVPSVADWCSLDVVTADGSLRRVEIAGVDPERERFARDVYQRYPADTVSRKWYAQALRRGEPILIEDFNEEALSEASRSDEHLAMLRRFGFRSAMCVPMMARDRLIGLITLATAESGRRFGPAEVSLVQSLADRAALAIDNARRFEAARDAARVREEVVAIVSHDLRNPLAVVAANASLLREELPPPEQAAAIGRIELATDRMRRMIGDLLDAARIEAGALAIRPLPEPVASLVADACELVQPAAGSRSVTVERSVEPRLSAHADRDRFVQVLANLLDNAVRHSPTGGRVEVAARSHDDGVLCSISDQGPGVSPDRRDRIFERFWRDEHERIPGTGLGLAIARGLVELHGGRIWVESPTSGGARFCFTIPAAPAPR